jgi:hypothetical protein
LDGSQQYKPETEDDHRVSGRLYGYLCQPRWWTHPSRKIPHDRRFSAYLEPVGPRVIDRQAFSEDNKAVVSRNNIVITEAIGCLAVVAARLNRPDQKYNARYSCENKEKRTPQPAMPITGCDGQNEDENKDESDHDGEGRFKAEDLRYRNARRSVLVNTLNRQNLKFSERNESLKNTDNAEQAHKDQQKVRRKPNHPWRNAMPSGDEFNRFCRMIQGTPSCSR